MELAIRNEGNTLNQCLKPVTYSVPSSLDAILHANGLMELFNRDLRFEKHEETGLIQISIVDGNDGKVIT